MKVIIAPDKFKGSLSANEAATAIARGISEILPEASYILHPLADGGEGSLAAIHSAIGGEFKAATVSDPLGRQILARYLIAGNAAYIEMASASGLELLAEEGRNCCDTSTYGTGELILHAVNSGAREVYLCLGGSATCDAGTGMAEALGFRFLDAEGNRVKPIGRNLVSIHSIETPRVDSAFRSARFTTLVDVRNPLFGPNGAAYVYAPQKGASEAEVVLLDDGLRNISALFERELGKRIADMPGSGAAGGLGAGAMAFLGAKVVSGSEEITRITGFGEKLINADLVITGEGRLDEQSKQGKVVSAVVEMALSKDIPVAVVCGINALSFDDPFLSKLSAIESLVGNGVTHRMAIERADEYIIAATGRLIQHVSDIWQPEQ